MRIAIIGVGHMGSAIAKGLSRGGIIPDENICCTDPSQKALDALQAEHPAFKITTKNSEAVQWADIIIMVVKPWLMEQVVTEIKPDIDPGKHQIVSVAATITLGQLEEWFPDGVFAPYAGLPLFRIVPNLALEVGEGVTLMTSSRASEAQKEYLLKLFNAMGYASFIEERLIPAATALASCGLAYAMKYIQAATSGSVELGLYPQQARELAIHTVIGAARLLEQSGKHPEAAIDEVTTPGGLTIRGIHAMEEAGFSNAILQGLKKSL